MGNKVFRLSPVDWDCRKQVHMKNPMAPGRILEEYIVRNSRLGLVQFGDTRRLIFLNLVPRAKPGDYILAHVGFATTCVDEQEAKRIRASLERAVNAKKES